MTTQIESNPAELDQEFAPLAERLAELNRSMDMVYNGTIEEAYEIAHDIGTQIMETTPGAEAATDLIKSNHSDNWPRMQLTFDRSSDAHRGTHNEVTQVLTVNHKTIYDSATFKEDLDRRKVTLKQESHASLIQFFKTAAHEYGHSLLANVGRELRHNTGADFSHLTATKTYLDKHPEEAFTGNWESDAAIHEERFAEGYARLCTTEALTALGYSKKDVKKVLGALKHGIDVSGPQQGNQIDHLSVVGATVEVTDKVVNGSKNQQTNSGKLGYNRPLSKRQVLRQLNELAAAKQAGTVVTEKDGNQWEASVQKQRSYTNRRYLKRIGKLRYNALNPEKVAKRERKQNIGAAAFVGATLLVGSVAVTHEYDVEHSPVTPQPGVEQLFHDPALGSVDYDATSKGSTVTAELLTASPSNSVAANKLEDIMYDQSTRTTTLYWQTPNGLKIGVTNAKTVPQQTSHETKSVLAAVQQINLNTAQDSLIHITGGNTEAVVVDNSVAEFTDDDGHIYDIFSTQKLTPPTIGQATAAKKPAHK